VSQSTGKMNHRPSFSKAFLFINSANEVRISDFVRLLPITSKLCPNCFPITFPVLERTEATWNRDRERFNCGPQHALTPRRRRSPPPSQVRHVVTTPGLAHAVQTKLALSVVEQRRPVVGQLAEDIRTMAKKLLLGLYNPNYILEPN